MDQFGQWLDMDRARFFSCPSTGAYVADAWAWTDMSHINSRTFDSWLRQVNGWTKQGYGVIFVGGVLYIVRMSSQIERSIEGCPPPPGRAEDPRWEETTEVYIKRVSEFISFLSLRQHKLEDVLSHLVHRVLVDLQATSIFVSSLSPENNVEHVAQFGVDPHIWELYPKTIPIFAKYPITDAMRTRKTTWINTLPDWGDEYPLLKPIEFPGKEKTFIGMAIEKCGTPVAVVGIFAAPVIEVDGETDAFLGTIANILSLYLYDEHDVPELSNIRSGKSAAMKKVKRDETLTERQMLILKMISENRTNILISELLGYSESTIRQETIKIYAKLGCNGREEASLIYREGLKQELSAS